LARVLANVLGIEARRGIQFRGGPGRWEESDAMNPGEPDVVTSIEALHIECKRSERLRLYEALDQAIGDAGGKLPIVCHRQNHREWVAIVRLEDLPRLAAILTTFNEKGATP
jgi:hypothetical protein